MVLFYFQHVSVFKWNEGRNRRLSRALLRTKELSPLFLLANFLKAITTYMKY